jgi:ElaB/YqjD/DUF883 family membrane-anchored ribosome-binding protein
MTQAKDESGKLARDPEIVHAEAEIARTREAVAQSVMALQQEISRTLDWREWVRRRPFLAVAVALGTGALLGCLQPTNCDPRRR